MCKLLGADLAKLNEDMHGQMMIHIKNDPGESTTIYRGWDFSDEILVFQWVKDFNKGDVNEVFIVKGEGKNS